MTKKEFKSIASYICAMIDPDMRLNAAIAVASGCKAVNNAFDERAFFKECGVIVL